MKKGLFSILAGALLVVGCQNYDDQFSNIESQITALASQVAGLSQVQGDLTALANTVNSLQSSVGDTVDAALADGLADIDSAVASLEAATASAASSEDVAAIATAVAANQEDLTEILAQSSVFSGAVVVNSVSTLDAYHSMGDALAIVAGNVTIDPKADMDATKLSELSDVFKTITGNLSVTSNASTIAELVFNNLTGVSSLTLKQAGGYHFPLLQSASTINLKDDYESTITRVNFPALTSVVSMGTDSYTNNLIEFTKATSINFAALPRYGAALEFIAKKGKADDVVTLDITALRDVGVDGTTISALALKISGPNVVAITALDGKGGSIQLTNVLDATITDYDGEIKIAAGVEKVSSNNVVELSGVMTDLTDITITGVLDPNNTTGTGADKSGPLVDLDGLSDLVNVNLAGNFADVDVDNNGNVEKVIISANVNNGSISISTNSDLETLTLTNSKANGVTVNANNSLISATINTTMQKTLATTGAGSTLDGSIVVTSNTDLESLTIAASNVAVLTITGNVDLVSIDGSGLLTIGATAASNNVTISGNKLTASIAQDLTNATSCTLCTDLEVNDLGKFTTVSKMATMKVYLGLVAGNTASTASVYFDTVESTTGATGIETQPETSTAGDLTVILKKSALVPATVVGAGSAVKEQRAWLIDISTDDKLNVLVDSVEIIHDGTSFDGVRMTGNAALDLVAIKSALTTSRATTLGVALGVALSGDSTAPSIVFPTGVTSASNGENYTNAQVAAIGNATNKAFLTTYDKITMTIGNLSVTATMTGAASATTGDASALIASALDVAWNAKYGASGGSNTMSIWGDVEGESTSGTISIAAKASDRGSRGFGNVVSIAWAQATAAQVSLATAGASTQTSALVFDWTIGTTELTTDNAAVGTNIIMTLTEVTNSVDNSTNQATATVYDSHTIPVGSNLTELFSTELLNTYPSGTATSTVLNIYPTQARLDVINSEGATEGVVTVAGVAAVNKTRVHWFD